MAMIHILKIKKKILKNKEHCLNKHHLKEEDYDYDVGKCEEGLLLESSKNAGLECGYFLLILKLILKKV